MARQFSAVFILAISLFSGTVKAQLSEGGVPLKVRLLKSSKGSMVEMPSFLQYFSGEAEDSEDEPGLKPFRFAHPYEVNLTTSNSGEWYSSAEDETMAIWRLTVKSPGAYSINLIFDEFEMPLQSRLFIYSETEEYLTGAFTSANNAGSHKFAIAPVAGDEITIQYEVPENMKDIAPFRIVQVNHDFVGILKSGIRRPLGKAAGTCNIDINCDAWEDWADIKNSVVRLIINGVEVCSGVLVNNTAEDQKPYVLSAAHCYDSWSYAQTTVYAFNYESPFCEPLDGDPSNTLSGAVMKAKFDSLDFALAQLNTVPPPDYRPYYAGWNRTTDIPQSTVSIHHPQGDIKKISNDTDSPSIASFNNAYVKSAFLKISRWEYGVTEAGSSGGPLFDENHLLRGTLTGGEAVCKSPVNDYFNRFSLAWDYKSDTTKQLEYWLDPLKTSPETLAGKQFNEGEDLCGTFTNLTDDDSYTLVPALNGTTYAGYWGGSNSLGITEVMEKFETDRNLHLIGISLGVAKIKNVVKSADSEITIKIYNGSNEPGGLIYSQIVKTSELVTDAMNYIPFSEVVKPETGFFAGFEITNVQSPDSFAIYQSLKASTFTNTLFLKKDNQWSSFTDLRTDKKTMVNIIELVACNINDFNTDTPLVEDPVDIAVFPNPVRSKFTLEAGKNISEDQFTVFNMAGQECSVGTNRISERKLEVDMRGNTPGIYFVRYNSGSGFITEKISFIPW